MTRSPFFPSQAGITLKKPESDTDKTFTETELFEALSDIYAFCFMDIEGGQILKTKNRVETHIQQLMDHIEANVGGSIVKRVRPLVPLLRPSVANLVCGQLSVNGIVGTLSRMFGNKQDLADRLQNAGASTSQNTNSILAVMVGASVELAQGMTACPVLHVEDLSLNPSSALTLMLNILLDQADVTKALMGASEADVLEGYVTEMLRIDPPIQGIYREAKANEVVGSTSITAGDLVFLDITTANKNVSLVLFFLL